jgi:putative inorganic carbon (hco3(-)) transporter
MRCAGARGRANEWPTRAWATGRAVRHDAHGHQSQRGEAVLSPAQPYFYLLAYLVFVFIRPQEYVPSLVGSPVIPVLLVAVTLFWLVAQKKNFDAPQHRLIPALVAVAFVSVALTGWVSGAVTAVVEFAPTIILFYLVATSVDSVRRFKQMGLVLTAVCCIMAVHGTDQAASEEGVGWTGAKMIAGRITYLGFLNDPNDLAMAFVMALPFALYLANSARSFIVQCVGYGASALIAYGIYLCNSRGSLLAIGAMLFAYSVLRFGWKRSLIAGPILAVPLLLLAPSRVGEISADEESAAGRVDAWYEGFQMLRDRPLFGVGKGNFTEYNELTAHNSFVLAFSEMGLVGYFVWLSLIVLSAMMLRQILRTQDPPAAPADSPMGGDPQAEQEEWSAWQAITRTLMYSFVGTMVAAFFLSRTYTAVIYLAIGLVVAAHQVMRSRWPAIEPIRFGENWKFLLKAEFASLIGLYVLMKLLLR